MVKRGAGLRPRYVRQIFQSIFSLFSVYAQCKSFAPHTDFFTLFYTCQSIRLQVRDVDVTSPDPQEACIHPSSVNARLGGKQWNTLSPYVVFHERVRTTKVYVEASLYNILRFSVWREICVHTEK